jgi:O-antigen ligase/tetratricopeptide (TPR) repeat protein
MGKNKPRATQAASGKQLVEPIRIPVLVLLFAYGFVTVLTPRLMAFDSNAPKFFTFSLLNLFAFLYLFTRKDLITRPEWYYAFFRSGIGLAWLGLILLSLLSFVKAINVLESVLHFSKFITTITAGYLISVLILQDKRNVLYLSAGMTLLLLFDSLTVFSEIYKFIRGDVVSISDIKSVYSNKNILASTIFVKMPFALWLMVYHNKWLKRAGIIALFVAITAVLFMSARAFYLGLLTVSGLLLLFLVVRFRQMKDKKQLRHAGVFGVLLICGFLAFSVTRQFYPKTADGYTKSFTERLATMADGTGGGRYDGWKRSWNAFKEAPVLGVGLGNWKVVTVREETRERSDYTTLLKAHNDFIEITTETGIFGGLLYLSIFVLAVGAFIKVLIKTPRSEYLPLLFLSAFGLICYSFDAFFNFPQDRADLQVIFALYIGLSIAVESLSKPAGSVMPQSGERAIQAGSNIRIPAIVLYSMVLISVSYILYLNFKSQQIQRIVQGELTVGKLNHPASLLLDGFPFIPDINAVGEPIAVQKARYLLHEKRYDEVIAILKNDKSSPYDPRREFHIGIAYYEQKNYDSSFVYLEKAYQMKPNFFEHIAGYSELLQKNGREPEGEAMITAYLKNSNKNKDAWRYASTFYERAGDLKQAAAMMDSATFHFPKDTLVAKQKAELNRTILMEVGQSLLDSAIAAYKIKNYEESARLYSELLARAPDLVEARINRAFCYYFTKEFAKSNQDLDMLISGGLNRPNLFNLRGVNYFNLGNKEEACKNYKIAADMDDKEGKINYSNSCQPVK